MASSEGANHYNGDLGPDLFAPTTNQRPSLFSQRLPLSDTTSPEEAKRALEAHLAETETRIEEAGRLGTTLVQQRKELAARLREVEHQQDDGDITPDLRLKLVALEREYNEVGKESARAYAPKSRQSSSEMGSSKTPYPLESKVHTTAFCMQRGSLGESLFELSAVALLPCLHIHIS